MSIVEVTRCTGRQRAIEPYLNHLRTSRLDSDIKHMKGPDEWIDNVRVWVDVISYVAGKSRIHKPLRYTQAEEELSDILLAETVAALGTGAHYPAARKKIFEHGDEWHKFLEYVDHQLESDVVKLTDKAN